jgi:hypothetical protein
MDTGESHASPDFPAAKSTGLIEFETAEVISQMIYPPRPVLVVTGTKPYPAMKVELVPLTYIRQPEYWGIEVIGANQSKQMPVATEDATSVVGTVEGGRFRPLYSTWITEQSLRLTTASVKDDSGPEVHEIDVSQYDGSILRVLGHHEKGWIYSATIAEQVRDSILAIVARQVFPDRAS